MPNSVAAVFFDFDGTTADTDTVHFEIWNQLLKPHQLSIDLDFYNRYCAGISTDKSAESICRTFPAAGISAEELGNHKDRIFVDWIHQHTIPLMPGTLAMLDFLAAQNIKIGIVTGAPLNEILPTLRRHQLDQRFQLMVTSEQVTRLKPAPDAYLLAAQQLALAPGQCVALEDTAVGVQAAKAAGVITCAIPQRFTQQNDFSQADIVCENMFQAQQWIKNHWLN